MEIKLSVIIPTYNCSSLLLRCLQSLEQQTASKSDYEVIVVDDGSSDDTGEILEKFVKKTSLSLKILYEPHQGPAAARNKGIANAQTEWIGFLDSDMVINPEWISKGLALLRYNPNAGGFEGRTEIGEREKVTPFTHQLSNVKGGRYQTCNLILRKSLCQFYPAYKIPFREDTDLAFSILERGHEIVFDPTLLAYHPPIHPRYDRPIRDALRYYYDGLLERRFPHRYKSEVDVHYIGKIKLPHLRRKIYSAFAWSQMIFLLSMLLSAVPTSIVMVFGAVHLFAFSTVILIHLRHIQYTQLKWIDFLGIIGVAYIVPWVLIIQRWRGLIAFKNESEFSIENLQIYQLAVPKNKSSRKIIPLHSHTQMKQEANSVFTDKPSYYGRK
ncbi:MAG: glycosyltransferase family 2 protein [SAR324 cluster bacterium]|nr:glycosyltransferase family 2 protein [SAR324 cluster bacterium]